MFIMDRFALYRDFGFTVIMTLKLEHFGFPEYEEKEMTSQTDYYLVVFEDKLTKYD